MYIINISLKHIQGEEMEILSQYEIEEFSKVPILTDKQRDYYFNINIDLLNNLLSNYKSENIVYIIILYGYFRFSNIFYDVSNKNITDLKYIQKKYNLTILKDNIPTRTIRSYKNKIKQYLQINEYTDKIKKILIKEATILASNFTNRKKIFYSLVNLSKKLKIEIPSYTELSKIITIAIHSQKKDILNKLEPFIKDEKLNVLDDFLQKDKVKDRWQLSYYKKLEHSINKNKILLSLAKFNTIKSKFKMTKSIIDNIGLTPKIASYNARWIEKSQVFQVKRKKDIESNFLLLSFVYDQYLIRNDNLIDRFISTIQTAKNSSLRAQKEYVFEQEPSKNQAIKLFEDTSFLLLNEIKKVTDDINLSNIKKVEAISKLIENKINTLADVSTKNQILNKNLKYDFIESKSISLQGKLSSIIKEIEFDEESSNKDIIEAINYFRDNAKITNKAPSLFLDEDEQIAIFNGDKFRISLYKVLLFFHISDAIKNGTLNLKYSYRYKKFDDYMISEDD